MSNKLELVEQSATLLDAYGLECIEKAGRTCYASVSKTDCKDKTGLTCANLGEPCGECEHHSSYRFTKSIIGSKHEAMLEHLNTAFIIPDNLKDELNKIQHVYLKYFNITDFDRCVISGNMRAWRELVLHLPTQFVLALAFAVKEKYDLMFSGLSMEVDALLDNHVPLFEPVVVEPLDMPFKERVYHQYISMVLETNRSTCMCVIRHRPNSFAMTSTRWIKFDALKITLPVWADKKLLRTMFDSKDTHELIFDLVPGSFQQFPHSNDSCKINDFYSDAQTKLDKIPEWLFYMSCMQAQQRYTQLMEAGWDRGEAREVLPNGLHASLVVTTNIREWWVMLNIRKYGLTGKPHAQIKDLFTKVHTLLEGQYPDHFGKWYKERINALKNKLEHSLHPMEFIRVLEDRDAILCEKQKT